MWTTDGSGRLSDDKLLERVMRDTDDSLRAFGPYETPALCLQQLSRTDRNGVGIGTAPYRRVVERLTELSQNRDS